MSLTLIDAALRLAAAAVLSGFIGFEREFQQKPAGLRTHMLVGLGSALFAIVSINSFDAEDPSRIAAQVVTGVGFLGAGAIFREGQFVRGLTTAAGLWTVAAIGLAAGAGDVGLAGVATAVVLIVLLVLGALESYLSRTQQVELRVFISDLDALGRVTKTARKTDPSIEEISFESTDDSSEGCLILRAGPKRAEVLAAMISAVQGVIRVERA